MPYKESTPDAGANKQEITMAYFVYARFKSEQAAWNALEDCFAYGEVSQSEFHSIARNGSVWELRLRA
jgi:hypothetical protein